jgi:hypothetical protein
VHDGKHDESYHLYGRGDQDQRIGTLENYSSIFSEIVDTYELVVMVIVDVFRRELNSKPLIAIEKNSLKNELVHFNLLCPWCKYITTDKRGQVIL